MAKLPSSAPLGSFHPLHDADAVARAVKRMVIGQDDFVDAFVPYLCLALQGRLALMAGADENEVPRLASAFIVGPTASGKTHVLKTVSREMGLACRFIDCSSLTGAGWRGNSVDTELAALAVEQRADPDAITLLVWDEADKMRIDGRVSTDHSFNAQHTLLKPLDGGLYRIERDNGRGDVVDMDRVVNVFAGAFTGIESIVAERHRAGAPTLGFTAEAAGTPDAEQVRRLRDDVQVGDFVAWGMMPELCGRCGAVFTLPALQPDDLARIVKGTEFSLERKFARIAPPRCSFELEGSAALFVAESATASGLGVRALENALAPVASKAIADARRNKATGIVIAAGDGALTYRLSFEPSSATCGPQSSWEDAGEPDCSSGQTEYERATRAHVAVIDRRCAPFDLAYFTRSERGIARVASTLAEHAVESGALEDAPCSLATLEAFVEVLLHAATLKLGATCSLGSLYAEARAASNAVEYVAGFTERVLAAALANDEQAGEEWNRMSAKVREAREALGDDFGPLARMLSRYLRNLIFGDNFAQLKELIYERVPVDCDQCLYWLMAFEQAS